MAFHDTQNPGIGGLDELTDAETLVVQSIASLGAPYKLLRVNAAGTGVEWGYALTVAAVAPSSPATGDLWVDTA